MSAQCWANYRDVHTTTELKVSAYTYTRLMEKYQEHTDECRDVDLLIRPPGNENMQAY